MSRENQIGCNGARIEDRKDSGAVIFSATTNDIVKLPPPQTGKNGLTVCEIPLMQGSVSLVGREANLLYALAGSSRSEPVSGPVIGQTIGSRPDGVSTVVTRARKLLEPTDIEISAVNKGRRRGYYLQDASREDNQPEDPSKMFVGSEDPLVVEGIIGVGAINADIVGFLRSLRRGGRLKAFELSEELGLDVQPESAARMIRRLKAQTGEVLSSDWRIETFPGRKDAGYELVKRKKESKREVLFNG